MSIENKYKGKTPEQVWDKLWDEKARWHFIIDHFENTTKELGEQREYLKSNWRDLPNKIKAAVTKHVLIDTPYEKGGEIKDQYKGKTYGEIWDAWSPEQKKHFLLDHLNLEDRRESAIKKITDKSAKEMADIIYSPNSVRDGVDYGDIHNYLITHVQGGQYAKGGDIKGGKSFAGSEPRMREFFSMNKNEFLKLNTRFSEGDYDATYQEVGFLVSSIDPLKIKNDVFYIGQPTEEKFVNTGKTFWRQKVGGESAGGGKAISEDEAKNKSTLELYAKLFGIKRVTEKEWEVMQPPFDKMGKGGTIGQKKKVARVMHEFKEGKLYSSSGDKVTDRKQAIAIAMSEAGLSRKMDFGGVIPSSFLFHYTHCGAVGFGNYFGASARKYGRGGDVAQNKKLKKLYKPVQGGVSPKMMKEFKEQGLFAFKRTTNGLVVAEDLKTHLYGLYTTEGEVIAEPNYQFIDEEVNANGMARVTHVDGTSGAIEAFIERDEMSQGGEAGKSRDDYEEYLNEIGEMYDIESDEWIIAGKNRYNDFGGKYGAAIRKHDPIGFNAGYNDWK